jgi:hypothetical protein
VPLELDAILPDVLREIVQEAIEQHMPEERFEGLMAAQKDEQRQMAAATTDRNDELVREMEAYLATLPEAA